MADWSLTQYLAEHEVEGHKVEIAGTQYSLPAKLPLSISLAAQRGDNEAALASLFGEENVDEIAKYFDREALDAMVLELYGADVGESPASSPSSKSTGKRSRPTSQGSTTA